MTDIAKLGLEVTTGQSQRRVDRLDKSLDRVGKTGDKTKSIMGGLSATFAAGLIGRAVIQNTVEQQRANAQLNAVLASTGGIAGQTRAELDAYADSLQLTTNFGNDATQSVQGLLLTFKDIRGETFGEATKAVLDMAQAMAGGGPADLKGASIQVGKALNDPILGITALSRVGIQFSESQRQVIKDLVETGDKAEAQRIILAELESQFGGSAEAARNTLGGSIAFAKNQLGDFFEVSENGSMVFVDAFNAIGHAIPRVREVFDAFFGGAQILASEAAVQVGKFQLAIAKVHGFVQRIVPGGEDGSETIRQAEQNLRFLREAADEVQLEIVTGKTAAEGYAGALAMVAEESDEVTAATERTVEGVRRQTETLVSAHADVAAIFDRLAAERRESAQAIGADAQAMLDNVLREVEERKRGAAEASQAERDAARETQAVYEETARAVREVMAGAFHGITEDGLESFEDFVAEVADIFARLASEIAAALAADAIGLDDLLADLREGVELSKQQRAIAGAGAGFGVGFGVGGQTSNRGLGALGGAASGAATGAAIGGPVGAVVGGIAGAIGGWLGASKKAREEAEEARKAAERQAEAARRAREAAEREAFARAASIEAVERDIAEREALLRVESDLDRVRVTKLASNEREIAQARELVRAGRMTEEQLERLTRVLGLELAQAIEAVEQAAAQASANMRSELIGRGLDLLGNSEEAGRFRLRERHRREIAGTDAANLPLLDAIHDLEALAFDQEHELRRQTDAINAAAEAQIRALDESVELARQQLAVSEDGVRDQRSTVQALRSVIDSLKSFNSDLLLGSFSPLSPTAQLAEARRQLTAARQGASDPAIAATVPGLVNTFLEASRAVNASSLGFVRDFDFARKLVAEVEALASNRLSTEEQILAELVAQSAALRQQIAELEAAKSQAAADAASQIAAIESAAQAELDAMGRQLKELVNQTRIAEETRVEFVKTPPAVPVWDDTNIVDRLDRNIDAVNGSVAVLQSGFNRLAQRLDDNNRVLDGLRSRQTEPAE